MSKGTKSFLIRLHGTNIRPIEDGEQYLIEGIASRITGIGKDGAICGDIDGQPERLIPGMEIQIDGIPALIKSIDANDGCLTIGAAIGQNGAQEAGAKAAGHQI